MAKYESIPTIVDAEQWFESKPCRGVKHQLVDLGRAEFCVTTIHDQKVVVKDGDWIVEEPDGIHYYPIKDDIFQQRYRLVV